MSTYERLVNSQNFFSPYLTQEDFSRLGRSLIQTGQLIEYIFPSYGIRVVSINDNFDTGESISRVNTIVPFKNLIDMMYSKNVSQKTKNSIGILRSNGINVYKKAPFGYSLNNEYNLVINPETAPVVKQIFDLYLEYKSVRKVSEYLSNHKIATPYNFMKNEPGLKIWSRSTIRDILTNPTYIGNFTQARKESNYYETGDIRIKYADSSKWVTHENTHEKIVDKEIFDEVWKILNSSSSHKKKRNGENNIFLGKMYCGICGSKIQKCGGNSDTSSYVCYTRMISKEACNTKYISSKSFNNMILKLVKEKIRSKLKYDTSDSTKSKKEIKNIEKEIEKIKDIINKIKQEKFELYDKYIQKEIGENTFVSVKSKCDEDLSGYNNHIKELKNIISKLSTDKAKITAMKLHARDRVLTKELVDLMISKITIYDKHNIKIDWQY